MRKMMIVPIAFTAIAMVMLSGCARKGGQKANGGLDGNSADYINVEEDVLGNPQITNDGKSAFGGALGERFDETRQRIAGADIEPIYFAFDSSFVPQTEIAKVEAAAQYLNDNPSYVMIIEGHCDERGSNEYNISLSEQRALGVKTYLTNLGIDEARLQTRAFGEEKPAVPGNSEEAFRLNRRGEFVPYK